MSTLPPAPDARPRPVSPAFSAFASRSLLAAILPASLLALLLSLALWGLTANAARAQSPEQPQGGPPSGAQGGIGRAPGGRLTDPVVREADLAVPAVVRIATLYSSHITLNVCNQSVTLPKSGPGYSEGVLGSGAFVSAQGDILTADHLIHVDHTTLEQQLLADPAAQADIANALNASPCFGFGPAIAAADIGNGFLQSTGVDYQTTFDSPATYVWRDISYSGPLAGLKGDSADLLASLMSAPHDQANILQTSDFTHDDLAVLHVNEQNTPSIQLDDSSTVQALDTLTIIGFPGNGDANNDPTNLLTPSFNLASVSAVKTNTDGSELIQVGGNIEHGDSGGPALDASGRIVGVVSFGGPDNQGITAFLRSSDSARRLLALAKVNSRPGALETAWERAFGDYAATYPGHWRRSSQELGALVKAYPQFKGATPYMSWAQVQARHERLPQQRPTLAPFSLVALGTLAALALVLIALTLFRAARGTPFGGGALAPQSFRGALARSYATPSLGEQPNGSALLTALDDQLTPLSQRMN